MMLLAARLSPFFQWLLRSTVQASVLICLIVALQSLLRRRLAPRWHYALWLLLLVRMVMPWAPESNLSVFNLVPMWRQKSLTLAPGDTVQDVGNVSTVTPPQALPVPAIKEIPEGVAVTAPPSRTSSRWIELRSVLFSSRMLPVVWAVGALIVAAWLCAENLVLAAKIRRERPLTDQQVLDLIESCKATMRIHTPLTVAETSKIKSPALFGFIRPRLLLPEGMIHALSADELRFVFLHELSHLKRHDIIVNWLMTLLQVVHWFNPLIWYAFYRMRADRELACDALALSRTQPGEAQQYGRTIVHLLERFSQPRRLPGMAGILEDRLQLRRRITMIALFKRDTYWRSALAVTVILALSCVVLTDARGTRGGAPSRDAALVVPISEDEKASHDAKMEEIRAKLDTFVDIDFAKGTDMRDILRFVSDFVSVNLVLDERVMLPPADFPVPPGTESARPLPGGIQPTIPSEMHRIYLRKIPLSEALEAAFKPAGLGYTVQPHFIWISRPDVLKDESFEPVAARLILPPVQGERREALIARLQRIRLQLQSNVNVDFAMGTDFRDILMFLSDFADVNLVADERVMLPPDGNTHRQVDGIERNVERRIHRVYVKDIPLGYALVAMLRPMGLDYRVLPEYVWISRADVLQSETFEPLEARLAVPSGQEGESEALAHKLETMREKLQSKVNVDFAEGTDVRDVLQFLSDFVGLNIVLDERVVLPYAFSPTSSSESTPAPSGDIERAILSETRRIYLKHIPLGDALVAISKPMGLDYKVLPEYVWVSTPDVLRREATGNPKDATETTTVKIGEQTTVESRVVDGRIVDKIDYPFVNDPAAIGTWKSVDFVKEVEDFKPEAKRWKEDLYLKEFVILDGGKTFRPWWTWTKGLIFHHGDKTASTYIIKELDGATYMFFEWKSGDYTIRQMKPQWYVLKKVSDRAEYIPASSTIDSSGRIVDKIDYPFVNDPALIGTWKSVDFVQEIEDFKPKMVQWKRDLARKSELYLKEMVIVERGKTSRPWWTWTKGLIFHSGDKTASKYIIKELEGATYMFFEWKSGDYSIRHMKPQYYVLEKVSGEVSEEDKAWAAAAATDLDFRREAIAKIPQLDIDNAALDDVIALLGEPLVYVWENETFEKDNLPHQYILCYPDHFDVYMRGDQIVELRYYNPGYFFKDSLQVGSPLDDVLTVVGQPTETVEGKPNEFKDGVLYKDIDGRDGYCYYHRADQNVRFFFSDYKVNALYVTRGTHAEGRVRAEGTRPTGQVESEVKEYLDLGRGFYSEGKYEDALKQFQRVLLIEPDNAAAIESMRRCAEYLASRPAEDRDAVISRIRKIEENLEKTVDIDFPIGTDIRDVLTFLEDFAGANIVLDERVMVDSQLSKKAAAKRAAKTYIEPNVGSAIRRVYLKDIPLKDALKAILVQMGLDYKVQPEFIWVSRPDVLRHESFEPLETRYYLLQHISGDEAITRLRAATATTGSAYYGDYDIYWRDVIPEIIEPYTGRVLSYMEFNPEASLLTIHNTPSNLEIIEKVLERLDRPLPYTPVSSSR